MIYQITQRKHMLIIAAVFLVCGILLEKKLTFGSSVQKAGVCTTSGNEECLHEGHGEEASSSVHEEGEALHVHEGVITLEDSAIRQFGIELAQASAGTIGIDFSFPAEIALNEDRKAHVVPRIPGVVRSVSKTLGDKVRAGEVLAVIHSRELADFKAAYLAAREKLLLAETMFEREKALWEKKITAEQDYLNAKRDEAEARIELRAAEQKLHALGFSEDYLKKLPNAPEESYIIYEITAPIDGSVIEKHITMGEMLKDDSEPFVIADLTHVWVNVNISQKDLSKVNPGQNALVKTDYAQGEGVVSYVSRLVDKKSRTGIARIVLANDEDRWRPGTFAMVAVYVEESDCRVVVPKESVVAVEGLSMVFVPAEKGYKPQQVQIGRMNSESAEILSGLEQGQAYVAKGAFTLKSEMNKSTGDPCGGH